MAVKLRHGGDRVLDRLQVALRQALRRCSHLLSRDAKLLGSERHPIDALQAMDHATIAIRLHLGEDASD